MNNVLVTGGAGYIGSHIVEQLLFLLRVILKILNNYLKQFINIKLIQ